MMDVCREVVPPEVRSRTASGSPATCSRRVGTGSRRRPGLDAAGTTTRRLRIEPATAMPRGAPAPTGRPCVSGPHDHGAVPHDQRRASGGGRHAAADAHAAAHDRRSPTGPPTRRTSTPRRAGRRAWPPMRPSSCGSRASRSTSRSARGLVGRVRRAAASCAPWTASTCRSAGARSWPSSASPARARRRPAGSS